MSCCYQFSTWLGITVNCRWNNNHGLTLGPVHDQRTRKIKQNRTIVQMIRHDCPIAPSCSVRFVCPDNLKTCSSGCSHFAVSCNTDQCARHADSQARFETLQVVTWTITFGLLTDFRRTQSAMT